jgi:DnaJ-class molecular chaperone
MTTTKNEPCQNCDGTGEENCALRGNGGCEGSGYDLDQSECTMCRGTGKLPCPVCGGKGYVVVKPAAST